MITFNIQTVLIITLVCGGVNIAASDGFILCAPRRMFQNFLDRTVGVGLSDCICKPLFDCVICQASVWSAALFWMFGVSVYHLPLLMLAVCGMNVVFCAVIKYLDF